MGSLLRKWREVDVIFLERLFRFRKGNTLKERFVSEVPILTTDTLGVTFITDL